MMVLPNLGKEAVRGESVVGDGVGYVLEGRV